LEEIKLNNKEKDGLKNKLAKGNKWAIKDSTTGVQRAVSFPC